MLLAFFLAAGAVGSEPAPPAVRAEAAASKTEVTVGEAFTIEVKAEGPAGTSFAFAAEGGGEQLELRTPAASASSPMPGRHTYEAAAFALGDVEIPPLPVRYRLADGTEGEARTAPIRLKVVSLLPKDPAEQKLADIRGPVSVDVGRAFWIALTVVLLLLVGLGLWLWRRKRAASQPETAIPEVPPDEEALRALERLASSGNLARREFRPFYIALTAIAKRYLERRLDAPVQEMTSAEMVAFLRDAAHGQELVGPLRDLANAADRVKFARGAGLTEEAERHLSDVRFAVKALETRLRPAETSAQPPAGRAA